MYFAYGQTETDYLKAKDSRLAAVIDRLGHINRTVDTNLFSSVVHHIIGQQISTKAQATIWQRMQDALGTVTADSIAAAGVPLLQSLGMTFRKAEYITDFAEKIRCSACSGRTCSATMIWRSNADCAWYITTAKLTANCLRNIIGDSVRTAAWPVCIYGKSPAVRYRVCAIMRL